MGDKIMAGSCVMATWMSDMAEKKKEMKYNQHFLENKTLLALYALNFTMILKYFKIMLLKLHPREPIFPRQIHPCHIFVKSKLCQIGGKFSTCFFSKWKKTEISAYFRFNLLFISIFSAVQKEYAN